VVAAECSGLLRKREYRTVLGCSERIKINF
jgi:hypothetical protein